MFPGINPKKIQSVMKQMGINQEEIDASRVVIEKANSRKIVIENPSVTKITMQGQESFQITGDISEQDSISEEDIKTVMEKTGCDEKTAKQTLEETGDLAEAIIKING